jgi:hypothetical protein
VPRRNHQAYRPSHSFVLVDLDQSLTQRVDGHTHDGVGLGIETGPPSQRLGRNRVFLDLVRPALEVFLADILKHPPEVVRSAKKA